jgi:hypothetical protein
MEEEGKAMKTHRLSKAKCVMLIKDELKDAKKYDKLGFHIIAKDERRHAKIIRGACRG